MSKSTSPSTTPSSFPSGTLTLAFSLHLKTTLTTSSGVIRAGLLSTLLANQTLHPGLILGLLSSPVLAGCSLDTTVATLATTTQASSSSLSTSTLTFVLTILPPLSASTHTCISAALQGAELSPTVALALAVSVVGGQSPSPNLLVESSASVVVIQGPSTVNPPFWNTDSIAVLSGSCAAGLLGVMVCAMGVRRALVRGGGGGGGGRSNSSKGKGPDAAAMASSAPKSPKRFISPLQGGGKDTGFVVNPLDSTAVHALKMNPFAPPAQQQENPSTHKRVSLTAPPTTTAKELGVEGGVKEEEVQSKGRERSQREHHATALAEAKWRGGKGELPPGWSMRLGVVIDPSGKAALEDPRKSIHLYKAAFIQALERGEDVAFFP